MTGLMLNSFKMGLFKILHTAKEEEDRQQIWTCHSSRKEKEEITVLRHVNVSRTN